MDNKELKERIEKLGDIGMYKEQADVFLKECNVIFEAIKAVPQISPNWAKDGKHGTCYSITLAKMKGEMRPSQYIASLKEMQYWVDTQVQFFFWDSIANKEKARHGIEKKPRAYDVISGLYISNCDSFDDFCSNFGYSNDSIEAEKTYKEVIALNDKLSRIFTDEQLEILSIIA